MSSCQMGLASR